jgi:hypothetical protein
LIQIKTLRGQKGRKAAPDVGAIKQTIAELNKVNTDKLLGDRILLDLSARAFADGYASEALQLLPSDEPGSKMQPKYAALLRDLTVMALGEGSVHTETARHAIGDPQTGGKTVRGPPPEGLRILIPEGNIESWRPAIGDSVLEDLSPLQEDLGQTEVALRARAKVEFTKETDFVEREKVKVMVQVLNRDPPYVPMPADDKKKDIEDLDQFIAEVEARLGRTLSAAERASARDWRRANQSIFQIMARLGQANGNQPERVFRFTEIPDF